MKYSLMLLFVVITISDAISEGFPISNSLINSPSSYTNNPYYNQYTKKMAKPITALGTGITAGDCQNTVRSLITSYCGRNNNCINTTEKEINYKIITELSMFNNKEYITCQGYIQPIFNEYKTNNKVSINSFPMASFPNAALTNNASSFPTNKGKEDIEESFPLTYNSSRSFAQRKQETLNDIQAYKDLDTYQEAPTFKTEDRKKKKKEDVEKILALLKSRCELSNDRNKPATGKRYKMREELATLIIEECYKDIKACKENKIYLKCDEKDNCEWDLKESVETDVEATAVNVYDGIVNQSVEYYKGRDYWYGGLIGLWCEEREEIVQQAPVVETSTDNNSDNNDSDNNDSDNSSSDNTETGDDEIMIRYIGVE